MYWFPVLLGPTPVLNPDFTIQTKSDDLLKTVNLFEGETREISIGVLAGKIGYLWWAVNGDDFNILSSQTELPRAFVHDLWSDLPLSELGAELVEKSLGEHIGTLKKGSLYVNIRWPQIRDTTDQFDRMVLEKMGHLDWWRELNIWYRQTMMSAEDSSSRPIPIEVVKADVY
jgi:hypothetical protein